MYVWAAFEAKSPPTCQDLVTLYPIALSTLHEYENLEKLFSIISTVLPLICGRG